MTTKNDSNPSPSEKLTEDEVSRMSDQEILLRLARESLVKYGTALPPFLTTHTHPTPVQTPVVRAPGRPTTTKIVNGQKECPHCGTVKALSNYGVTMHRGRQIHQSWCNSCRSATSAAYKADPQRG